MRLGSSLRIASVALVMGSVLLATAASAQTDPECLADGSPPPGVSACHTCSDGFDGPRIPCDAGSMSPWQVIGLLVVFAGLLALAVLPYVFATRVAREHGLDPEEMRATVFLWGGYGLAWQVARHYSRRPASPAPDTPPDLSEHLQAISARLDERRRRRTGHP